MYHLWAFLMALGFGFPIASLMRLTTLWSGLFVGACNILFTHMIHGL